MTVERALVVYVEDNQDNLHLVRRALETTGLYDVLGAGDGVTGLDLVRSKQPALVLLDLDLPVLDGFQVAKQIRADSKTAHIPIIAVSANVMRGERQRSVDAGCMAYLEKPFDIVALRQLVADCIRRSLAR